MANYKPQPVRTVEVEAGDVACWEDDVRAFYDSVSPDYEEVHRGRFCDEILEYFLTQLLASPPARVLDLGGGVGRFSIPLLKRGYAVTLVDISSEMAAVAAAAARSEGLELKCIASSATDLSGIDSGSCEIVISLNSVLDYCSDYMKAFDEARRVLVSGGVFIGSVSNVFMYARAAELRSGDIELFRQSMSSGNRKLTWGGVGRWHLTHDFTCEELLGALGRASFADIRVLGPFNLLGKYFSDREYLDRLNRESFFRLQMEYAGKSEYLSHSDDFLFVCRKLE